MEQIVAEELSVEKRDGSLVPFDRARILKGIKKAAAIEELPLSTLNAVVDRVVQSMPSATTVSTADIGEIVLREMDLSSALTDVARTRYAMVFYGKGARGRRTGISLFLAWMDDTYPDQKPPPDDIGGPIKVIKNDGSIDDFDRNKLERSIGIESKRRGQDDLSTASFARRLAGEVSIALDGQRTVSSNQIAGEVLSRLRLEPQRQLAYLRYASAVKRFHDVRDIWNEALALPT